MKNTNVSRIRLVLIAGLLAVVVSTSSIGTVRADGTILRGFDVPALVPQSPSVVISPAIYWPIGIAFDGRNLWYSQPCFCTPDIFQTTTNGVLLKTLLGLDQAGALAWDGSHLWVAIGAGFTRTCIAGASGCALLFQLDMSTGTIMKILDISSIFAADQECNFIDGLDFDTSTGSLWVSPDIGCAFAFTNNACGIGFVYNIDTSGNLLKRVQLPFGVAGVAKVGSFLYMVTCGTSTSGGRLVHKTTFDGTVVSTFVATTITGNSESAEDLAFDPVTFAPKCALWIVKDYGFPFDGALGAYQIDCP